MNNRKAFSFSSEAFAGARITHRYQKETKPEGQHDDIQHEERVVALLSERDCCAFREKNARDHAQWTSSRSTLRICFREADHGNVIGK